MLLALLVACILYPYNGFWVRYAGRKSTVLWTTLRHFPLNRDLKDDILLFNTLSRKKEIFKSKNPGKVTFYSCGPTVYDFAHIGNFRAFLTYDLIKRWLQYCGFEVDHVCNLTDVDDKIIVKMKAEGKSLESITNTYALAFFDDLEMLNIRKARIYPRVTDHMKDIESMISALIEKGFAYIENGSVYYRVSSFADYGKLSNLKASFDEVRDGAGESGPNARRGTEEKENNRDFALWKAYSPQDLDVVWDSPFGRGRPGWHIECSAMCCRLLGPTIDIHAGGIDLVFPHHENEIAQTEAYSGQKFSNYWMHNGFVNINNEKMSKSLKNFKTLRDIATTPFDVRTFRFLVVTSQYRGSLNFSPDTLKAAAQSLRRIDKLVSALQSQVSTGPASDADAVHADDVENERGGGDVTMSSICDSSLEAFEKAMSDDLNTPRATAALFSLVGMAEKGIKSGSLSHSDADKALGTFKAMDEVFGVLYEPDTRYFRLPLSESAEIYVDNAALEKATALAAERSLAKAQKLFKEADALRKEIAALGFLVKDMPGGAFELAPTGTA